MRVLPSLLYRAKRAWWSIAKPITVGVRAVLVRKGQILLVRHTYQDAWYLPGGGVDGGEALEAAVRRELAEEVGAELGELELFGVYSNFYEGKSDHVVVYLCTEFRVVGGAGREIERFAFFEPQKLPEGTSPGTWRRVQEYLEGKPSSTCTW
jgi:ADP-ribose pyrophosphatase YjhB (NUDIX family)